MINNHLNKQTLWESIFKRKKGEGDYTKIFDNIQNSIKIEIKNKIDFVDNEIPVIISYKNSEEWILMTTTRIIKYSNSKIEYCVNDLIKNVSPPQFGTKRKNEWNELLLETKDNDQFVISIEGGKSLIGIWSIIKNIIENNR